jgi:hypothetical protein
MLYDHDELEIVQREFATVPRADIISPWVPGFIADFLADRDHNGTTILDIGPYDWDFAEIMRRRGAIVHGIDYLEELVALGRHRGYRAISGDIRESSVLDLVDKYDGIFCRGIIKALWHQNDAGAHTELVGRILNLLKPGGWVIVSPHPQMPVAGVGFFENHEIEEAIVAQLDAYKNAGFDMLDLGDKTVRRYGFTGYRHVYGRIAYTFNLKVPDRILSEGAFVNWNYRQRSPDNYVSQVIAARAAEERDTLIDYLLADTANSLRPSLQDLRIATASKWLHETFEAEFLTELTEIEQLIQAGRLAEVLASCDQIQKQNPASEIPFIGNALVYSAIGRFDLAVKQATQAWFVNNMLGGGGRLAAYDDLALKIRTWEQLRPETKPIEDLLILVRKQRETWRASPDQPNVAPHEEWNRLLADRRTFDETSGVTEIRRDGIIRAAKGRKHNPIPLSADNSSESKSSLALCFDGATVGQWYAARTFFDERHIRATFYVDDFGSRTTAEIDALLQLQALGHEIACGFNSSHEAMRHSDLNVCSIRAINDVFSDRELVPRHDTKLFGEALNATKKNSAIHVYGLDLSLPDIATHIFNTILQLEILANLKTSRVVGFTLGLFDARPGPPVATSLSYLDYLLSHADRLDFGYYTVRDIT